MTLTDDELFRELERELFAAHEGTPDLATIDRLYADDFLSTNADARVVDKKGWLDILKAGQFPVDRITTDDFKPISLNVASSPSENMIRFGADPSFDTSQARRSGSIVMQCGHVVLQNVTRVCLP